MNEPNDTLSRALERASEWRGGETAQWRMALERVRHEDRRRSAERILRWPVAGLAAAAAVVALVALTIPESGRAPQSTSRSTEDARDFSRMVAMSPRTAHEMPALAPQSDAPARRTPASPPFREAGTGFEVWSNGRSADADPLPAPWAPIDRTIVRQATMSLRTVDVRKAFNSALGLVDTLAGEFAERAAVSGEGDSLRGSITLRIGAGRVDEVMRSLREVAEVIEENTIAEDLTERVTDLGARLRNERRIEAELLALLDRRPEAPLADVLTVRNSLEEVRLRIERLEANRAGLDNRARLSSLRIEIVPPPSEDRREPKEGAAFLASLRKSFARGADALGESVSLIVEVAVGGLVIWVPLIVVGFWLYRSLAWRAT